MQHSIMEKIGCMVIMLAMTLLAGCISQKAEITLSTPSTTTTTIGPREGTTLPDSAVVLEIAGQIQEVKDFTSANSGYKHQLTVLTPENLTTLAKEYPALYGNLPEKTLYKVEYFPKSGSQGILVIVDLEEQKALKYFRTMQLALS